MAAPTTFYADSLEYINGVCDAYVGQNVAAVAHVVGPFLTYMLTMYIAMWGFASLRGLISEPLNEFLTRWLKITAILAIGFNLANYNTLITNTFLRGPDEFIRGLAKSPNTNDVISGLDAVFQMGTDLAGRFWAKAGVLNGDFGMYVIAIVVMGMTIVVTAYAFALMALSKVALTAVIAIGPIFFIGLLFESTAGYFNSWLQQLSNYFLVPVLVVMVNLLVMTLFSRAAKGATAITASIEITSIFPFVAMGFVCLLALASVLSIASGLAGGVSLSSFGMGRIGARLLGKGGARLIGGAASAGAYLPKKLGKTVARGAWNAYQNRKRNSIRPTASARRPRTIANKPKALPHKP